jgi:transketolase
MAGMINGIELHKGLKPFAGTFLIFSDYARNGIRMSALMGIPVIYVLTHDSIGLGEDGPTHQPIEQLASLRLIPGLHLWRPCDAFETQVAWQAALEEQNHPSVLALSRQNVPSLIDDVDYADAVKKGGYVLKPYAGADIVLVATGSEVALALEGAYALAEQNIHAQVVSMPCVEVFKQQSHAYQEQVLQSEVPLLFIEAGVSDYWYCLAYKRQASVIGIDKFGESAPSDDLFEHFNFNKTHVVNTAKRLIN